VGDIKRLKEEDIANRRKSMGPKIPVKLPVKDPAEGGDDQMERRPSATKRSDSGLGKMSSDSNS
jgi:hypothetical protein